MESSPVRLNLGCGHKLMTGFINVDLADNWSGFKPDVEADINLPLPFPDGHADEVHAYHVLEHFHRWKVDDILRDWKRVLKPGGKIVLELPCFDKVLGYMFDKVQKGEQFDARMTMWAMYGDPRYESEEMTHKWFWSMTELTDVLEDLGFDSIAVEQPQTHIPARDMRVTARKKMGV